MVVIGEYKTKVFRNELVKQILIFKMSSKNKKDYLKNHYSEFMKYLEVISLRKNIPLYDEDCSKWLSNQEEVKIKYVNPFFTLQHIIFKNLFDCLESWEQNQIFEKQNLITQQQLSENKILEISEYEIDKCFDRFEKLGFFSKEDIKTWKYKKEAILNFEESVYKEIKSLKYKSDHKSINLNELYFSLNNKFSEAKEFLITKDCIKFIINRLLKSCRIFEDSKWTYSSLE